MIPMSEVRADLLEKPCEKCGGTFEPKEDRILTFSGGSFIMLHKDCADFIQTATPGPRALNPEGADR